MSLKKTILICATLVTIPVVSFQFKSEVSSERVSASESKVQSEQTRESDKAVIIRHGNYKKYDSTEKLNLDASNIIKVKFNGNRETVEWKEQATGEVTYRNSLAEVVVEKVYKGDMKPNTTIKVYEPAFLTDSKYVTVEGYTLMEKEESYILYLEPEFKDTDAYPLVGLYQGKYSMNDGVPVAGMKNLNKKALSTADIKGLDYIGNDEDFARYKELKKQVKELYR